MSLKQGIRIAALIVLPHAFLFSAFANAQDKAFDEKKLKAISTQFITALEEKNLRVVKKYLFPGSKITVDLDPAPGKGQRQISYQQYMKVAELSVGLLGDIEFQPEFISLEIDEARQQATVHEKLTATSYMHGRAKQEITLNKTTFGYINGQLKVLSTEDEIVSSGSTY